VPRLWGYLGAGQREENGLWVDHPPAVLFEFTESREAIHPTTFLTDYHGYLQADDYGGYSALYRSGRVVEVGCWAHCRRKFFEIAKAQKTPGLASAALAWIARLYAIEKTIRDMTPDQKLRQRQEQTVPLLADFRRCRWAPAAAVAAGAAGPGIRLCLAQLGCADTLHRKRRAAAR
jgi:transposase